MAASSTQPSRSRAASGRARSGERLHLYLLLAFICCLPHLHVLAKQDDERTSTEFRPGGTRLPGVSRRRRSDRARHQRGHTSGESKVVLLRSDHCRSRTIQDLHNFANLFITIPLCLRLQSTRPWSVKVNKIFNARAAVLSRPVPSDVVSGTETTRYFAAAAYRDRLFRLQVLDYFKHRWHRAAAPEFGIDERFVHRHCRRADLQEFLRNIVMSVMFLIGTAIPIAWPAFVTETLPGFSAIFVLGYLFAAAIMFAERLYTDHYLVVHRFGRKRFVNSTGPVLSDFESQNLVVYGSYYPFVGSGFPLGAWSFSINLERTSEEFGKPMKAEPFETRSLLLYVGQRLDRLRNINLRYREVLFADGRTIRGNEFRLMQDGRPRRRIPVDVLEQLADSPELGTRSYLCIHVGDWGGEIVVSIYLRCRKQELRSLR